MHVGERDHVNPRRCTTSRRNAANSGPEVVAVERELDGRLQEVDLLAHVVAAVRADRAVHRLRLHEQRDRVGELELAACTRFDPIERVEDVGREEIAPAHREVRRRVLALRLLDDAAQLDEPVGRFADRIRAAVRGDFLRRHLLQRDHRVPELLPRGDHRTQQHGVVDHEIVGEQHRERFVADVIARDRHRVPESERILLAHVVDAARSVAVLHLVQEVELAVALEQRLELEVAVEVLLDRRACCDR